VKLARNGLLKIGASILVGALLVSQSYAVPLSGLSSPKYDVYFKEYSEKFIPEYDWHWIKAQAYQESLLQPEVRSHAGAQGIMQIMPGTWLDETDRLGIIASPFNPKINILVGVNYMRKMIAFWKAPRTKGERLELAQASYNAGAGNILKAQGRCGGATWNHIRKCLKSFTGTDNSHETIDYVQKIKRWYAKLVK